MARLMFSAPGSSPLTRGKHLKPGMPLRYSRLIPAHAGKTLQRGSRPQRAEAHPRSRGENTAIAVNFFGSIGSSPLTRGKPGHLQVLRETPGLIPAHAGKTAASPPPRPSPRAHPRSRGENVSAADAGAAVAGSSPLTRGKQDREARGAKVDGLIPAHAGKTSLPFGAKMKGTAHPRSRGENGRPSTGPRLVSGSSPLTRGKLVPGEIARAEDGLIPAHAGKT